jgi:hypothetical protein
MISDDQMPMNEELTARLNLSSWQVAGSIADLFQAPRAKEAGPVQQRHRTLELRQYRCAYNCTSATGSSRNYLAPLHGKYKHEIVQIV